ncbi:hypothetical protein F5X96DRAFT_687629 [Biscogniauxia mediterranea]|nr:hypothetical protein F5X96DRAFT_687629 [Biscogniauxia mediterranea]
MSSPPSPSPPAGEEPKNENKKKTFAFLGASTGCGLAALTRALAEGHTCVALCRRPARLTDRFLPAPSPPANLTVLRGDAHDPAAVRRCLLFSASSSLGGEAGEGEGEEGKGNGKGERLVDAVFTSVGSVPVPSRLFALADPHVCERGAEVLLGVLRDIVVTSTSTSTSSTSTSASGGDNGGKKAPPLVVAVSSAGVSRFGRDFPLLAAPVYKSLLLRGPHADKRSMERRIAAAAAAEDGAARYVIVRPSWLVDGDKEKEKEVRVGVEDWEKGVLRRELGWMISREAVGRWVWERVLRGVGDVEEEEEEFEGKIVSLTW